MHIFTSLLCLTGVLFSATALPSQEELLQTNKLCAYGNLDVWQIKEDEPDVVIHHRWPERSAFHVKQIATDRDHHQQEDYSRSSGESYQHHYNYDGDKSKKLHSNPKLTSRVFTIGMQAFMGLGVYGCELRFAIAPNVTGLVVSGKPIISARVFNWLHEWDFNPTWRNVMGSESSRACYLGPTIGKVRDVYPGQDDIINATACPAGMGTPKDKIWWLAFMFEMDEGVKENAEVEFTMWADHSLYNHTMTGVWTRFPSPICDS